MNVERTAGSEHYYTVHTIWNKVLNKSHTNNIPDHESDS